MLHFAADLASVLVPGPGPPQEAARSPGQLSHGPLHVLVLHPEGLRHVFAPEAVPGLLEVLSVSPQGPHVARGALGGGRGAPDVEREGRGVHLVGVRG